MAMPTTIRRTALAAALLTSAALAPASGSQAATPAPKAPTVSTGSYSQVNATSIAFKGSVNPHGLGTVYAFQFGTTTGYGAQTAPMSAGNGTTAINVSQIMTGFTPGTTYHYRLIATNAVGTANGHDATFTIKVPLKLGISASSNPVVYGDSFSIGGALSGTGAANRQVVLQTNPFPYFGGFKNSLGPELTDAGGRLSFAIGGLTETTQLRLVTVGTPSATSAVVTERVAVRVSMHLHSTGRHGFVRMSGAVTPAEVGAHVGFQLMRPGLRPLTVAGTLVRPASASTSRFSRVVRISREGLYRAFVHVNDGARVSGHSRPLLIR